MVRATGIEPVRPFGTRDFKSLASTNSATPAIISGLEQVQRLGRGAARHATKCPLDSPGEKEKAG